MSLVVIILGVILGLIVVVMLVILVLLWSRIIVEIITIGIRLLMREIKRINQIFRPVPEKVANFAVVNQFILRQRQWLRLNIFDIDELEGLWG